MAFQTTIPQYQPAPGIEGDWCTANRPASVPWGEGGLVAAASGAIVGRFGYATAAGLVSNVSTSSVRMGFIHKDQPVLITGYLGGSGMTVPPGQEITLHDVGDFFCRFAAGATIGQKVFASNTDGTATAGTAGGTVTGSTETGWFVDSTCAAGELAMISRRS